jgi:hypothetical protein
VAVGCSILAVAAQEQAPPERPTFRSGTDVLPLDVTVMTGLVPLAELPSA